MNRASLAHRIPPLGRQVVAAQSTHSGPFFREKTAQNGSRKNNEIVAFYAISGEDEVLPEHLCVLGGRGDTRFDSHGATSHRRSTANVQASRIAQSQRKS
jgi:hypothetical protein